MIGIRLLVEQGSSEPTKIMAGFLEQLESRLAMHKSQEDITKWYYQWKQIYKGVSY